LAWCLVIISESFIGKWVKTGIWVRICLKIMRRKICMLVYRTKRSKHVVRKIWMKEVLGI